MTNNSKSIRYYPLTELVTFIITGTLTFVIANSFNLSIWIPVLLTVISYFLFLGGTNVIFVTDDKIEITFLNLIGGQVSVELDKIVKIRTTETYEQDTTIDFESSFYVFRRNYNMEYTDNEDKKRILNFRISNKTKETEIISALKYSKE